VRVLRDVVVARMGGELLAISPAPAIIGEDMSVEVIGGGSDLRLQVRVLDSRPVIVDGAVRHRIRLALPVDTETEAGGTDVRQAAMTERAQ
jgi:hypothetical protein